MSPKMHQNTKNGDIFKKFASQRCKAIEALWQTLGLRVLLCIVGCAQLMCLKYKGHHHASELITFSTNVHVR